MSVPCFPCSVHGPWLTAVRGGARGVVRPVRRQAWAAQDPGDRGRLHPGQLRHLADRPGIYVRKATRGESYDVMVVLLLLLSMRMVVAVMVGEVDDADAAVADVCLDIVHNSADLTQLSANNPIRLERRHRHWHRPRHGSTLNLANPPS